MRGKGGYLMLPLLSAMRSAVWELLALGREKRGTKLTLTSMGKTWISLFVTVVILVKNDVAVRS